MHAGAPLQILVGLSAPLATSANGSLVLGALLSVYVLPALFVATGIALIDEAIAIGVALVMLPVGIIAGFISARAAFELGGSSVAFAVAHWTAFAGYAWCTVWRVRNPRGRSKNSRR